MLCRSKQQVTHQCNHLALASGATLVVISSILMNSALPNSSGSRKSSLLITAFLLLLLHKTAVGLASSSLHLATPLICQLKSLSLIILHFLPDFGN